MLEVISLSEIKAGKPLLGSLSIGDCPRCGLAPRLVADDQGRHLESDMADA